MRIACHRFLLLLTCLLAMPVWGANADCRPNGDTAIWFSPREPAAGEALKIMAVSTAGPVRELYLLDAEGHSTELRGPARGGPPWSLSADVDALPAGAKRVVATAQDGAQSCVELLAVNPQQAWSEPTEALFSAWIERLFDAPVEQEQAFPSLEPVLRDPQRNFLFNHLGMNEDRGLPATPDCADLPYYLRSYFAWKVGLPVGFRACSRGSAGAPPRCSGLTTHTEFTRGTVGASGFKALIRKVQDTAHSGSARTGLGDNATDFYPVPLSRETLWPGTVYADPYGHVLMIAKWVPQIADRTGVLLAVDAQPDNSVTRKRFWEGTFLFANTPSAGPGFKAFRPLLRDEAGRLGEPNNAQLTELPGVMPYDAGQDELSPDDFYAAMAELINPSGLEPRQAYDATLDALMEQLQTRVTSVENGEAYFRKNPGAVVAMPQGAAIFETIGPWEDYATPSRDMRLVIAMNVLNALPERIVRHPSLFRLDGAAPEQAAADLRDYHRQQIESRKLSYRRSDGSAWGLTAAELLARKPAFEVGYNPNDCPEVRWGAPAGSDEAATCKRRAPAGQRALLEQNRDWFRQARRPPR